MHDGTCGAKNSNFSEPIWRIIFLRSFSKFYGLHPVSLSSKVFRNNGHGRDITTARLQHSLPYAYARHWAHAISPLVKLLRQHRKSRPVWAGKQQFQGPSKSEPYSRVTKRCSRPTQVYFWQMMLLEMKKYFHRDFLQKRLNFKETILFPVRF